MKSRFMVSVRIVIIDSEKTETIEVTEGRFPIKFGSGLEWVKKLSRRFVDLFEIAMQEGNAK